MKMVKLTEDHYIVVDDTHKEMYTIPTSQAKELLGIVDIQKNAELNYPSHTGDWLSEEVLVRRLAYKNGYNEALEDNKDKQFTKEDMELAMLQMAEFIMNNIEGSKLTTHSSSQEKAKDIIKSISEKTEWEVESLDGKLILKS